MGAVDLDYLKQGFASLVQQAEQTTLQPFIFWLDLKVAEFKVNGFMILDDSRASCENWIEFVHRWRSQSIQGYPGYQYFYPPFANQNHPNQPPGPGGSHVAPDNPPHGRRSDPPSSGSGEMTNSLRHRIPEPVDTGQPPDGAQNVVQIKPEPEFERLPPDIRSDRPQIAMFNDTLQRRPSYDYAGIPDSIQQQIQQEQSRRERIPIPIDYPMHVERSMPRHNHDGHHDHLPPDFNPNSDVNRHKEPIVPDHHRPTTLAGSLQMKLDQQQREAVERDLHQTNVPGFIKMTPNSSGVPLVSRQTANRCPVCNRIFHYYSSFNRHMKLHQGVFTHICEVCRRKFTRKEHFVRHKCHRRPNKPSRMADQSDTSSLGVSDPLVQPPPNSNEPSPREVSIPPPLIHISQMADTIAASSSSSSSLISDRNAFTYDQQPPLYADGGALPTSSTSSTTNAPMEVSHSGHNASESGTTPHGGGGSDQQQPHPPPHHRPPYFVEASNNNNNNIIINPNNNSKHRRKTTTPMKVENFMEPLPSIDTPTETPTRRSPVDMPDVFASSDKHHMMEYSGERPMTSSYRRASSSDLGRSSSSAGEFNISRPQSRNSEPARSSQSYGSSSSSFDHPALEALTTAATGVNINTTRDHNTDPGDKQQSGSGKSTPTPTSGGGGGLRDDQYPVLKKKVLEAAASSLSQQQHQQHRVDTNHNSEEGEEDSLGVSDRGGEFHDNGHHHHQQHHHHHYQQHAHHEQQHQQHQQHTSNDGSTSEHHASSVQPDHFRGYVINEEGSGSGDLHAADLSASGNTTGQSSPSGPDTACSTAVPTPTCAAPTTPTSADATPSSATALSPFDSQCGEQGALSNADLQYEQHISPPGSSTTSSSLTRDNPTSSASTTSPSLNSSLSLPSAYASSEPLSPTSSSPASRQGQQQQGDIHCQSCNRKFLHLSSLNRHMKLHQGVFSHACAVCSRKFTRKEHFVNHKCSRRPRNPTRLMDVDPESPQSMPQKVEFPPSMVTRSLSFEATAEAVATEALQGMPQKVEFPPSMVPQQLNPEAAEAAPESLQGMPPSVVPRQPSPPLAAAAWNTGAAVGALGLGAGLPQPGPPLAAESTSPPITSPSSPEQRRFPKWKSKWK